MKKRLQKVVNFLLDTKKYSKLKKVEVFFVFGSKHKSAMCDWVYGIKITASYAAKSTDTLIKEFQMDIKKVTDKFIQQSVCCTDVMFEGS